jgi:two-component system, chemotaxis family, protein-glutamate methylesterase/glutaminase
LISVLIVEDSPAAAELLRYLIESDPEMKVVGIARDGLEGITAVRIQKPDVVIMDIIMPRMDGFEATRRIMESAPTPIVITSASYNPGEVDKTFRALESGALAIVAKPRGKGHVDFTLRARELVETVKLMSEIKVVRRRSHHTDKRLGGTDPAVAITTNTPVDIALVAIVASTGGPPVLHTILSRLTKKFPVPVLIVQHIASGFTLGFIEWLGKSSGFSVHLAVQGDQPLPGHAYVAPDDQHLGIDAAGRVVLSREEPMNGLRPAGSYLFHAVAQCLGKRAVGVLLTGMGKDGAQELKEMRDQGALTIAQDQASAVVFGMPGEAVRIGAAAYVLPPEEIASLLTTVIGNR